MPVQTMQTIAEHQFFKAAMPVVGAALVGSVTWLFVTVMNLEKEVHLVTEGNIPAIELKLLELTDLTEDIEADLEDLRNKLTDVRIDHSGMKQQLQSNPADRHNDN